MISIVGTSSFESLTQGNGPYTVPAVTGIADGDLMIMTVEVNDVIPDNNSQAWIVAPPNWNDLMDGYLGSVTPAPFSDNVQAKIPSTVAHQSDYGWWVGWKIASSEPSDYDITTDGFGFFGFNGPTFGLTASIVALRDVPAGYPFLGVNFSSINTPPGGHSAHELPTVVPWSTDTLIGRGHGVDASGGARLVVVDEDTKILVVGIYAAWVGSATGVTWDAPMSELVESFQPSAPQDGDSIAYQLATRVGKGLRVMMQITDHPYANAHPLIPRQ